MECKYVSGIFNHCSKHELIDTLWNVNTIYNAERRRAEKGINRYIMECKLTPRADLKTEDFRINRYIMECKCILNCLLSIVLLPN